MGGQKSVSCFYGVWGQAVWEREVWDPAFPAMTERVKILIMSNE